MARICVIVHELGSSDHRVWDVVAAAQARGDTILLLTGRVGDEAAGAIRENARRAGAEYRHLDELPSDFGGTVFPPVEAHRYGLRVADALRHLAAAEAWFVGQPAHAAATGAARKCGRLEQLQRLKLVISTLREFARVQAGVFPDGSRESIATEFLEKRAVGFADEVVCEGPELEKWVERMAPMRFGAANGQRESASLDPARDRSGPCAPPTISVCVTYYEKAPYLKEALDSLTRQTQRPFEVIVIDDGSRTESAADAWKKANDRYWPLGWKFIRQDNAGPAAARMRAAREATGDAVLFCDADNRFRPEMVATFAAAMARSGADCIACAFQAFEEPPLGGEEKEAHVFAPLGPCEELGLLENVLGDTTSLFRREAFFAAGGFRPGLVNEDWRLMLEWLRAGRSYETVPAVLFDYRLAATGRSRNEAEYRSAADVILPLVADDPALTSLWPHMVGAMRDPRAAKLEAELADVRAALTSTAREVYEIGLREEALKSLDRMRRAHVKLLERTHRKREEEAAAAKAAAADLRQKLATLTDQAAKDRLTAEKELTAIQGRLSRINSSFSWKLTSPLRFLRRKFLDPRTHSAPPPQTRAAPSAQPPLPRQVAAPTVRGGTERPGPPDIQTPAAALASPGALGGQPSGHAAPAGSTSNNKNLGVGGHAGAGTGDVAAVAIAPATAANPDIAYHIDAPRLWNREDADIVIRGWCFLKAPGRLVAIRARAGAREYAGQYGMERPDLAAIFPDWPHCAFSGFKIEARLTAQDEAVVLEAQDAEGSWHLFLHRPLGSANTHAPRGTYEHWLREHPDPDTQTLNRLRIEAARLAGPKISVLMPVFNPAEKWLARAIESIRTQTYPHWELCIADDASSAAHVLPLLQRHASEDPRIKLVHRPDNGHISAATNSALELATGEFSALFDHDDELPPHALQCVAAELAAHPATDLLYTDEDKIDEQGFRFDPHFKPDWNPELLCGQNYLSHLAVYRTALLRRLGGLREGFEGCQDWDLALRATDAIDGAHIRHIPRVLYHWRANEGSTALHLGEKKYVSDAARRALEEHFARVHLTVELEKTLGGHWHPIYPLPRHRPLVSILIPTRNAGELVELCLASIFARTQYAPYEILLVDNRSDDPASLEIFAAAEREDAVRVLRYDAPFNYSAINNFAAREARGEILCLLNNDIEVLEPNWLDEMVAHALRSSVGAVGARLYYPDFRLQHAGVITGLGGVAGHAFKYFERADPGTPQFRPHLAQNLSVVTAACLVIRKELFLRVGGFDEQGLTVAFNDVDFCLKVEALGLRNLYTPFAELVHHESASRGPEDTPEKIRRFQAEIETIKARWGPRLLLDPAYNPNLSLDTEDFALAYPPRVPPL